MGVPHAVTIVVSTASQLDTVEQVCRGCAARGLGVTIAVVPDARAATVARLEGAAVDWCFIDPRERRVRRLLLDVLYLSLTAARSSIYAEARVRATVTNGRLSGRLLGGLRAVLPKLEGPVLNRTLGRVGRVLCPRRVLPTEVVIAITHCRGLLELTAGSHRVVVVQDGLDHVSKEPCGFPADVVVAWNDDLAADWARHQGPAPHVVARPAKFEYAAAVADRHPPRADPPHVVYALSSFPSGGSIANERFVEEVRLMRAFVEQAAVAFPTAELSVKPHPIGKPGHLDEHLEDLSVPVHVLPYEGSPTGDYVLSSAYNGGRAALLEEASLVVGIWTTFLLDSAVAGVPVTMIDVRGSDAFPRLVWSLQGPHVRHLEEQVGYLLSIDADGRLHTPDGLAALIDQATERSASTRAWLLGAGPLDAAIPAAIDRLDAASPPTARGLG